MDDGVDEGLLDRVEHGGDHTNSETNAFNPGHTSVVPRRLSVLWRAHHVLVKLAQRWLEVTNDVGDESGPTGRGSEGDAADDLVEEDELPDGDLALGDDRVTKGDGNVGDFLTTEALGDLGEDAGKVLNGESLSTNDRGGFAGAHERVDLRQERRKLALERRFEVVRSDTHSDVLGSLDVP